MGSMGSIGDQDPGNGHTTKLKEARDVFFFAYPRTTSHVLCRLLSNQPGWVQSDYYFYEAFEWARKTFGWGRPDTISSQQHRAFEQLLQKGFEEILRDRQSAANENKKFFLTEHAFYVWEPSKLLQSMWGGPLLQPDLTVQKDPTVGSPLDAPSKTNSTIFPDEFLKTWRPIFLIRHPALAFESWYRAEHNGRNADIFDKSWAFYTTMQYPRQMYDWYSLNKTDSQSIPIVIDADDILADSSAVQRLCVSLGMDPQFVLKNWTTIEPPKNPTNRQLNFMSAYWNSTGIDKSKSSRGLDLKARHGLWQVEFGSEVADELWRLVEKAMPDYTFMKSRKI